MSKTMTRWGIGPRFALFSLVYIAIAGGVRLAFPARFDVSFMPFQVRVWACIGMLGVGVPFWLMGVRSAMRAFHAGELCTDGVFAWCRHPIYGAWIVFITPGLVLLIDVWSALVVAVAMSLTAKKLVREEETYLAEKFGEEYEAYRRRVPAFLPLGVLKRK